MIYSFPLPNEVDVVQELNLFCQAVFMHKFSINAQNRNKRDFSVKLLF